MYLILFYTTVIIIIIIIIYDNVVLLSQYAFNVIYSYNQHFCYVCVRWSPHSDQYP